MPMLSRFLTRYSFLLGTLITIAANAFIEMSQLGGETSATISARLPTLITPAGFTFSIWSVIYAALIIVGIMIALKKITIDTKTAWLYLLSCLANCLWLVVRHYGLITISVVVILVILGSLFSLIRHLIDTGKKDSLLYKALMLYFGWVLLATLLCLTAYLTHFATRFTPYVLPWCIACLIRAGILNIIIINKQKTIITSCVLLRALYGIYMAQSNDLILTSTVIIGAAVGGYMLMKKLLGE